MADLTPGNARRVAEQALNSLEAEAAIDADGGTVLDPVPIHSPDGAAGGWFVPVEESGLLRGFVQVDAHGRFHRYSMFTGDGVAPSSWIDPAAIVARAGTIAEPHEQLGAPTLTWDRSPDRLVWRVVATDPRGGTRAIFVAGTVVWTDR